MEIGIEIKNLSKYYGEKKALDRISLTIPKGMYGLLGPNGAGKTTLMKVLATLVPKSAGEVTICGISSEKQKEIRSIIGYLPQDFSMYGNMSAYEALDYLAVLSGLNKEQRKKRVAQLLEQVNLGEQRKTKVKAMSGGMRRRLGIAQAVIHNPAVIIVDEPTAGLDPEERVRFRNLLCEMAQERVVLLSTHIVGDIEATCEKIAVLNKGKICFEGLVEELLKIVEGKVFAADVSVAELNKIKEQYPVSGILTKGNTATVKIIAETQPFAQAKECRGDVEDAYMYLMHFRGEEWKHV